MKNPYDILAAKTAKIAKSARQFFLQYITNENGDGYVYLSDSFFILKVSEPLYRWAFMPVSPIFIDVAGIEHAEINRMMDDKIPVKRPNSPDFAKLHDDNKIASMGHKALVTHFMWDMDSKLLRIVRYGEGEQVTAIDEKYADMLRPVAFNKVETAGKSSPIAFSDGHFDAEAMVCPVRIQADTWKDLLTLGCGY